MNTMLKELTEREKRDLNQIEDAVDSLKYLIDDVKDLINDCRDKIDDPKNSETLELIALIKYYYKRTLKAILQKADLEKRYWELTPHERDTSLMED